MLHDSLSLRRTAVAVIAAALFPLLSVANDRLVILHTNDTHSAIDPAPGGKGGILRRKVLVDSVRNAEKNVIVIDAGDAVQGTLFYSIFKGEVERLMMDAIGYDYQIVGNHEFDNGLAPLANNIGKSNAKWISTNYDVRGTVLDSLITPYDIRPIGSHKVGIIGINLNPDGMINADNIKGVTYLPAIKAANATAWHLKHNERVDLVIMVSHIGYDSKPVPADLDIAAASEDIDIIIGGHSHTELDPARAPRSRWIVGNAAGDSVLVAQTGALGRSVGRIAIDFGDAKPAIDYSLIDVDSRLDAKIDPAMAAMLAPYRSKVDSILTLKIAVAADSLTKKDLSLVNLVSDIVMSIGSELNGSPVDLALANKGGVRCDLPGGDITRGQIMQMLPFDNRVVVIDVKGSDLAEAFDVMAGRGGDGVAGASAIFDPATGKCSSITVGSAQLDTDKTYRVATLDYLAGGGDYLSSLKRSKEISRSSRIFYEDAIDRMSGKTLRADTAPRMTAR